MTPYYAPEVEFGGPPSTVHELCGALHRVGVEVRVVTTATEARDEVIDGVQITRVRRRTRLGFGAVIDHALDEHLRQADACHVHTLFNWTAWSGASRARRLERPTIVSPRGMLEPAARAHHALRKRLAWQLMDRRMIRHAAAVVAATQGEAESLSALGLAPVVVPNGIELPRSLPPRGQFRAARGIAPDARIITFLGRLHPIKRLDLLANAFLQIAARNPQAVLVVAGPDEAGLWPDIHRRLATVSDRVHWTGPVDATEKWRVLADSDALVLCSDSESYGRVVAEALVAGVPAVATRTCPWQLVEREEIGRWVPQTPPAIADAVEALLSDAASHRAMSARARAYALAHLGLDGIVARYVALYESVIRASRTPAIAAQAGI